MATRGQGWILGLLDENGRPPPCYGNWVRLGTIAIFQTSHSNVLQYFQFNPIYCPMSTSTIFVVSDTHFNHTNILKFLDAKGKVFRPFTCVEEMNETMISRWNSVVHDQDIIYHLGDVYLTDGKGANAILHRLRGRKRLLLGNHDNGCDQILHRHFQKIGIWRQWPEHGLIFSHMALHPDSLRLHRAGVDAVNVHGHIHQNDSPPGPYINVSVEKTNWGPVAFEDLLVMAKKLRSA